MHKRWPLFLPPGHYEANSHHFPPQDKPLHSPPPSKQTLEDVFVCNNLGGPQSGVSCYCEFQVGCPTIELSSLWNARFQCSLIGQFESTNQDCQNLWFCMICYFQNSILCCLATDLKLNATVLFLKVGKKKKKLCTSLAVIIRNNYSTENHKCRIIRSLTRGRTSQMSFWHLIETAIRGYHVYRVLWELHVMRVATTMTGIHFGMRSEKFLVFV